MPPDARDLIFVSYSHRDKAWLEKLFIFLKPYQRKGQLTVWADPYIQVGDVWKREIDQALPRAKVGLLLVSPHFLASDFIMDHEVPQLEQATEDGEAKLCCVPLSSSVVEPTGLNKYQWVRPSGDALDLLKEPQQHAALVTITKQLVEMFHGFQPKSASLVQEPTLCGPLTVSYIPSPVTHRVAQPVPVSQDQAERGCLRRAESATSFSRSAGRVEPSQDRVDQRSAWCHWAHWRKH